MSNIELWNKYSDTYLKVIEELFKNIRMYKSYETAIGELLEFGLKNNLPNVAKIVEDYISFLTKHLRYAFTYPNNFNLWARIIRCKNVSRQQLYNFLFEKVEINALSMSVPAKNYFDINDYVQTEFFNYCNVLTIIAGIDKTNFEKKYMPHLIDEINLSDLNKRQIFKGIFFNNISNEDVEKYSELSLYFFANFHNGTKESIYKSYKSTIESILKKKVIDIRTISFITASFLYYEQPNDEIINLIIRSSFKNQIYNYIFQLYWDTQKKPPYVGQYVNVLISTDGLFVAETIRKTLNYIRSNQKDEVDQMINIIKSANSVQSYKLKEEDFITYLFIIKNNSEVQLHYLVKLIGILCDKNYIIDTHEMESDLENILKTLANNNLNLETNNLLDHVSSFIRSSKMNEWNKNYRR